MNSTHKCNSWVNLEEYLIGCFHAKTFSGAVVQFIHGIVDFLRSDGGEIFALREILPNKAVGVFVQSALPGSVGMGELERVLQCLGNHLMLGKLPTIIRGQRVNPVGHRTQQLSYSLGDAGGQASERRAVSEEMQHFYQHLDRLLTTLQFGEGHSDKLHRKLTRLFNRARPYAQEIRTMRGIFSAVEEKIRR